MYYTLLFAVLLISSRGFFELFVSKNLAYIITFVGFTFFISCFIISLRASIKVQKKVIIVVVGYLVFSLLSWDLSLLLGLDAIYSVYMLYPVAVSVFFLFFHSIKLADINNEKLINSISYIVYLLFAAATLQQLFILSFPGETLTFGGLIRPSSLTGSYLHYPLIMVLLGVVVHSLAGKLNFTSMLAYLSVFISFSRSGMMLVSIILFMFLVKNLVHILKAKRIKIEKKFILFIFVFSFFSISFLIYFGIFDLIIQRFYSSVDSSGPGNEGRFYIWNYAINMIMNTNILIGEHFGEVTNLTSNLTTTSSMVVESGFLQNLINFGLIGTCFFYAMFIIMYINTQNFVFKSFIVAFVAQSFVYQSTEVLPFIIGSFLISLLVSQINIRENTQ